MSRHYCVPCHNNNPVLLQASDDVVRDTLYREYRKYGDISVRVMHEPDERVAYVYFRFVIQDLLIFLYVFTFFSQVI